MYKYSEAKYYIPTNEQCQKRYTYTNIRQYQQLNLEKAKKTPLHHKNDKAVGELIK